MLNRVVDQYQTAYGKIQEIIANTGFTPSGGMSSNIDNLGTASGAQDQVNDSNTIAPDYNPSGSVSDINTGARRKVIMIILKTLLVKNRILRIVRLQN